MPCHLLLPFKIFPAGISQSEFYRTLELQDEPQKKFIGQTNTGNTEYDMSLLQTHNAHKDIKGVEDSSIVQTYWITEPSPTPPSFYRHIY